MASSRLGYSCFLDLLKVNHSNEILNCTLTLLRGLAKCASVKHGLAAASPSHGTPQCFSVTLRLAIPTLIARQGFIFGQFLVDITGVDRSETGRLEITLLEPKMCGYPLTSPNASTLQNLKTCGPNAGGLQKLKSSSDQGMPDWAIVRCLARKCKNKGAGHCG